MSKTFFVTGGAGFIGSAVVRELLNNTDHTVVNVDKLTYAGNLESLESVAGNSRYTFIQADICDSDAMSKALAKHQPDIIMHLAAESHSQYQHQQRRRCRYRSRYYHPGASGSRGTSRRVSCAPSMCRRWPRMPSESARPSAPPR